MNIFNILGLDETIFEIKEFKQDLFTTEPIDAFKISFESNCYYFENMPAHILNKIKTFSAENENKDIEVKSNKYFLISLKKNKEDISLRFFAKKENFVGERQIRLNSLEPVLIKKNKKMLGDIFILKNSSILFITNKKWVDDVKYDIEIIADIKNIQEEHNGYKLFGDISLFNVISNGNFLFKAKIKFINNEFILFPINNFDSFSIKKSKRNNILETYNNLVDSLEAFNYDLSYTNIGINLSKVTDISRHYVFKKLNKLELKSPEEDDFWLEFIEDIKEEE